MSITGERDGRPIKPGPTIGDTGTGMLMAFSIVSALFDRARTGKGRRLQVAMQDSVMHYSRGMFVTQARTGAAAPRRPPSNNPPGGIYPCQLGNPNDYVYLLTSRANPEHWTRLLKLIGCEDLISDARYDTPDARLQREAEVDALVTGWTRERTKHEAMTQLSAVGVPVGAVLEPMELTNEPSFRRRGILQTMTHGEPRGKPGFSTFEGGCGRETDSPVAAASRPSQSASTSAVCSPSNGADLTAVGTPSKRTGQVGIVIVRSPCVIVCRMPRCRKLGSFVSSIESRTAPAGTPTALSCVIASCFVRCRVQAVTIASTSASRCKRASGVS